MSAAKVVRVRFREQQNAAAQPVLRDQAEVALAKVRGQSPARHGIRKCNGLPRCLEEQLEQRSAHLRAAADLDRESG